MPRSVTVFALCLCLCNSVIAQENRLVDTNTAPNSSAGSIDVKNKYVCLGFNNGTLWLVPIHSDQFLSIPCWYAHAKPVCSVAFSPDNKVFAAAATDGNIQFWDLESAVKYAEKTANKPPAKTQKVPLPTKIKSFRAHGEGWMVMTFSPDGKKLATAGKDGVIKIWNVKNLTSPVATLKAHKQGVNCLDFSPDGTLLASGSEDKTAKLWRLGEKNALDQTFADHDGPVLAVAFSADGKQVATGSGSAVGSKKSGQVKVWEAATGKALFSLSGHDDVVTSVCFNPIEPRLVSGSKDKTLRIWDLETKKELYKDVHVDGLYRVQMTTDGALIFSYSPDENKWWLGKPKPKDDKPSK